MSPIHDLQLDIGIDHKDATLLIQCVLQFMWLVEGIGIQ